MRVGISGLLGEKAVQSFRHSGRLDQAGQLQHRAGRVSAQRPVAHRKHPTPGMNQRLYISSARL